jgi:uncharacterized Zn-binding protein involved in type VI secretion
MAADKFDSDDTRTEILPSGTSTEAQHHTEGAFTNGLIGWFTVDGAPVAVVGSSGPNSSPDHKSAKVGKALVPLDTTVRILDGSDLMTVGGKPIAKPNSSCRVPDVKQPKKNAVIKPECDWFTIQGKRVVRGSA